LDLPEDEVDDVEDNGVHVFGFLDDGIWWHLTALDDGNRRRGSIIVGPFFTWSDLILYGTKIIILARGDLFVGIF
jgi:hypothetical protein